MGIRLVEATLTHVGEGTDRQTGMTKLIGASKPKIKSVCVQNTTVKCSQYVDYDKTAGGDRLCDQRRSFLPASNYPNMNVCLFIYSSAPVLTGNTFQDLPRLRETTDNTEGYI
jgi:hypothetical protein